MTRRFGLGLAVASALAGGAALAQSPQPPAFRTGVDVVLVEATVLDRRGAVVTGLGPTDFTAEVGGTSREIVSAELVEYAAPMADAPPGDVEITTNEPLDAGRTVVMLVDQASLRPEARYVLAAARRWVLSLGPKDRVALLTFPLTGPRVDFTTDHAKVADVLARIVGSGPPPPPFMNRNVSLWEAMRIAEGDTFIRDQVIARECGPPGRMEIGCPGQIDMQSKSVVFDARALAHPAVQTMRTLVRALGAVPGPKHGVLVSAGWPMNEREVVTEMSGLAADAARANVTIHTLTTPTWALAASRSKPNLRPIEDQNLLLSSVETLSGMTGGRAVRVATSADAPFTELDAALRGFYRLGIRALPEDLDGKEHRITLKVTRSGASLASYRRVIAGRPPAPAAPVDPEVALRDAITNGTTHTTVGLRATNYVLHGTTGTRDLRVVVAAHVARAASGTATVVAALYQLDGKSVGAKEATVDVPSTGSAPVAMTLDAPPGSYVLRLAVRDAEGRLGSLERLVDARWRKAGQVETPGLVLFRTARGAPSPTPLFDGVDRGDEIIVQLALAGQARQAKVDIDVTPVGAKAPLVHRLARLAETTSGQVVVHETIPAAQLTPGRYTLRATIGGGEATFTRAFSVRP
jgi:VWFA-related protein